MNGAAVLPVAITFLAAVLATGCGPAGPRAVLNGREYLERGDYARAIAEFRAATQLMPTNALAFSYLGLACHQAGQVAEAERAYQRALVLDHDLTEVHYDLGCLWLNQSNKLEQAKSELTTYTLRRSNSAEGWLKLGQAQLRLRELSAAEKSLNEALRLGPQNPESLTVMGLIRCQRRRPNEGAQFFSKALSEQPGYPPALLNLAIVAQQDLNDPRLALQRYREYLAIKPPPENFQNVSALVRQLEQELAPPTHEPAQAPLTHSSAPHTNAPQTPELPHSQAASKPPPTNIAHPAPPVRSEPPTNVARVPGPTNATKPPAPNPGSTQNLEIVKLGADPVIRPAEDVGTPPARTRPAETESPVEYSSATSSVPESRTAKKGFFQKINPMNLFGRDGKSTTSAASVGTTVENHSAEQAQGASGTPISNSVQARDFPRYSYRSPERPPAGDKQAAERFFAQGVQAQQANRLADAIQAYRRAVQSDPDYYDAEYNLGLAASEHGNLPLALTAYETALAIEPESLDARYNFGLVLKQAGYVLDAMTQFEKILAKFPNDGRTHLALGNLYAQQLQQPAKARQHYQAVLAIAPQSPQAGAIRYWLSDHPK